MQFHHATNELAQYQESAEQMYTGQQHTRLMRGIQALRHSHKFEIDLYVISAGYGVLKSDEVIVPYECTFTGMPTKQLLEWSYDLGIPQNIRHLFAQPANLVMVLLGRDYLRALQLDDTVTFASPTLFLTSEQCAKDIPGNNYVRSVSLSKQEAKHFRCGLVGLKGEVAALLLEQLAQAGDDLLTLLRQPDVDPLSLIEPPPLFVKPPSRTAIPRLDVVDKVISVLPSWEHQPHHNRMRFYIPDWEDMVDPDYDFDSDTHAGGRGTWSNQVYAHQLMDGLTCDGLLVSKAVIEKSKTKYEQIKRDGIHRYLRVPKDRVSVLGDCGAFSYVMQPEPPYTVEEVVSYYNDIGVNLGVSPDHLLFGAVNAVEREHRYQWTVHNAEQFLKEANAQRVKWKAIGAIQARSPQEFAKTALDYAKMGYDYIALGGLVRSTTADIMNIAHAVHDVLKDWHKPMQIHLFGVARQAALTELANLGITSVDTASYLRQAWMRRGENYIGADNGCLYAAIRIPFVRSFLRHEPLLERHEHFVQLEQQALKALRHYGRYGDKAISIDDCLNDIQAYAQAIGSKSINALREAYRVTLTERPWKRCDCNACTQSDIDVLIFRGNNRNRRRGFHNNYVFYNRFRDTFNNEESVMLPYQLPLAIQHESYL